MTSEDKAQDLIEKAEGVADKKVSLAEAVAQNLLEHANELARRDLLTKGIDTSRIPLICKDVAVIKLDLKWVKQLLMGLIAGMGTISTGVIVYLLTQK